MNSEWAIGLCACQFLITDSRESLCMIHSELGKLLILSHRKLFSHEFRSIFIAITVIFLMTYTEYEAGLRNRFTARTCPSTENSSLWRTLSPHGPLWGAIIQMEGRKVQQRFSSFMCKLY